eukprot:5181919-Pleurochrysis_carterae.AAC.1
MWRGDGLSNLLRFLSREQLRDVRHREGLALGERKYRVVSAGSHPRQNPLGDLRPSQVVVHAAHRRVDGVHVSTPRPQLRLLGSVREPVAGEGDQRAPCLRHLLGQAEGAGRRAVCSCTCKGEAATVPPSCWPRWVWVVSAPVQTGAATLLPRSAWSSGPGRSGWPAHPAAGAGSARPGANPSRPSSCLGGGSGGGGGGCGSVDVPAVTLCTVRIGCE